jgi:outer membrane protein
MLPARIINVTSLLAFLLPIWTMMSSMAFATESPDRTAPNASGTTLTWEQAIRTGLDKHPLIKFAQHEVRESEATVKQIESANYPQVTGVYANTGGNARVLANLGVSGSLPKPVTYLTTPGVRVDLLITDFGRTAHMVLSQKSLAKSAERTVLTTKALVVLKVQQAYLTCLKQQRLVTIAREIFKERELIRQQTEIFHRQQLRSKLDLDFASVEANRAELALIKAQNDLQASFAALNNAMGLQTGPAYALEQVTLAVQSAPTSEPLFREALTKRPELLGSKDRLQAAEEALKAAKALNFGNVTAIGTTGYTRWSGPEFAANGAQANPGEQLGWWGAGGTSAFPLYTGGRIQGQIEEADARKGERQADVRMIANDVILQVANAYLSRLTAEQQIKVAQEKVMHAREAMTLAQERYKASLGSILDVVTATADLLSAEVGLAESQYDYQASETALSYATGTGYERY